MRPIRITIEGLRSFRTEPAATIEFDNRDQIAIIGDTGAGKSSVLEAMTYALYGQTSYSGIANQELMNDASDYLRVRFRFWARSYTWEATRSLTRRKNGEVGGGAALLECYGDHDATRESVEGVKDVNRRVIELLGLDVNAFLRTIILPQGRFARLLTEDEPGKRSQILRQIWRTEDLDGAGAETHAAIAAAASLTDRMAIEIDHYPENPREHLDDLRKHAEAAAAEAERATAVAAERAPDAAAVRKAHETRERIEQTITTTADSRPDTETVAELAGTDRKLERKAADAAETERAAAAEAAGHPAPPAGAREAADRRIELVGAARAACVERNERQRQLDESTTPTKGAEAAARLLKEHEADGRTAETKRTIDRHRGALARIGELYDRYVYQVREPLGSARSEAARLEAAAEQSLVEATEAATEWEGAERRQERAHAALAAARHKEAAAHAAEGHAPGDDCPVCARELPEGWTAPEGVESGPAAGEAHDADRAARRAQSRAAETRGRAQQAAKRLQEATGRVETLEAAEGTQRAELLAVLGGDRNVWPEKAAALEPLREAIAEAEAELATLQQRASEVRTRAGVATAAHEGARTAHRDAIEDSVRRRNALAQSTGQAVAATGTLREALPETAAKGGGEPIMTLGALDGIEREAKAEIETVETARRHHADAASRLAAAARARSALNDDRRVLVTEPLSRALTVAGQQRERLHEAAVAVGAGTSVPRLPLTSDLEQAAVSIGRLAAAADKLAADCRTRLERASEAEAAARREAAERAGGEETADPERAAAEAAETAERARARRHAADAAAADFAARIADIEALHALAGETSRRRARLEELEDGLRPSRFPKWLTLRRSVNLLRHASRRLEQMSDRRYAFRDPRDTAEQWKILDRWSGATRSPGTLSGGEQFMASLALSLGMVETMGERGGRLECFFLDEGFGTLDARTLDDALDALERAATPDHMVGVITHVRQVAERIGAVPLVERDAASGSRARWLTEAERGRAFEDAGTLGLSSV